MLNNDRRSVTTAFADRVVCLIRYTLPGRSAVRSSIQQTTASNSWVITGSGVRPTDHLPASNVEVVGNLDGDGVGSVRLLHGAPRRFDGRDDALPCRRARSALADPGAGHPTLRSPHSHGSRGTPCGGGGRRIEWAFSTAAHRVHHAPAGFQGGPAAGHPGTKACSPTARPRCRR